MNVSKAKPGLAVEPPASATGLAGLRNTLRFLFLDEPPDNRSREVRYPVGKALAIAVVVFVLTLARKPYAVLVPQFWADDGTAFFQQAMDWGAGSFVVAHGGYYHTLIRLVAFSALWAPLPLAPHVYLLAAVITLLLVSFALFSPRLPLKYPTLMALCLGLVPHGGEVYFTLCNIHFYLALLLALVLVSDPPASKRQHGFDLVLLALVGLTGPFSLILFPLFVARAWRERVGALKARALVVGVAAAPQLAQVLGDRVGSAASQMNLPHVLEILGRRLLAPLLMGPLGGVDAPGLMLGTFTIAGLGFVAWALWAALRRKALYLLVAGMLVVASALYVSRGVPESLYNPYSQDRFFFVPLVLLMWCLVQALGIAGWARWLPAVLLALTAIRTIAQPSYPIFEMYNLRWAQSSRCIGGPVPCRIAINPPGWYVDYQPQKR